MDGFYGATGLEPPDVRRRQVDLALFSDPPAGYALLAWDASQLVGIASYSFLWPAVGLTRSLYLKELYVAEQRWRSRIGTDLMRALFKVAAKYECSRVEWTTDTDNAGAQRFYRDLGTTQIPKLFYRADRSAIESGLA
ncbi:GNAT family N-acetyltransferase [Actinomadura rubrisoli]|uniref:GNAT family N-acetyltransferase n=2 Tax=Actinomadura rubrisoli TaxID=2530368 RepID=A0A4R4ZW32_9ACTN|nr:GNAT family N-acetyltransferase [Actinomadura rubrisoli]